MHAKWVLVLVSQFLLQYHNGPQRSTGLRECCCKIKTSLATSRILPPCKVLKMRQGRDVKAIAGALEI